MKKLISILLCILVAMQIWVNYTSISSEQIIKMGNLEQEYGVAFSIPDNDEICRPDILFAILKETAIETNSNIVRSMFLDGEKEGSYEIRKYVLLSRNSEYYNSFELENGIGLTLEDTQSETADKFISTKEMNTTKQVGHIKSYMNNMELVVRPLYQQFSYYKADGLYYVELSDEISEEEFFEVLQKNISEISDISLEISELKETSVKVGIPYADVLMYQILVFIVGLFSCFLILYYLLREEKQIAVMKLQGVKKITIFYHILKEFLFVYPAFAVISTGILFLIFKDFEYTICLTKHILKIYLLLVIVMSVCFWKVQKENHILEAIKGNKKTTGIYIMNIIAKIVFIMFIIYTGQSLYTDLLELNVNQDMYKSWESANDYGVFYPYYNGNETTDEEELQRDIAVNGEFYKYINQKGAIYINAYAYENTYLELNKENIHAPYELAVSVNPNYLEKYHIYKENGEIVKISEDTTDWILLVPVCYKNVENEIIDYYKDSQEGSRVVDEEIYQVQVDEAIKNQNIKIIWIKDNQKVFSFNPDVNKENGSYIDNTILEVITENNSYICQRECVWGNGNRDPLKIKIEKDSKETYESLQEVLKEYGLDDNFKALVSINENAMEHNAKIKADIRLSVEIILLIFIILIFLITQNIIINFDKNKKDYIVKKVYGWSWNKIYGKYVGKNILMYLVILFVYKICLQCNQYLYLGIIGMILIVSQMLVTFWCTKHLENKKIGDTLKGA